MTLKNSTDRYGSVSVGLHWLTLAILVGVYACINLTDLYPKESDPREALRTWHFMLGLTVLALVALRLLNRLLAPAPAVMPPLPQWQQRLASGVHIALYALMVVMPLLAWLVLSAAGKPIPFFGTQLPALMAANQDLANQLKDVHETIGTIGYFLIGAHAGAALFHHFVSRDNTLSRMLPGGRKTSKGPA
jgi:cytochrome b561